MAGFHFESAPSTIDVDDVLVAVDSYRQVPRLKNRAGARCLLRFDDGIGSGVRADRIVSMLPGAAALSGPKYACLRPEYWPAPPPSPGRSDEVVVLITFGAGVVDTEPAPIVEQVRSVAPGATLRVVKGPFAGEETLRDAEIVESPQSLRAEIVRSDVVVCSGGQSMLEAAACARACVAIPVVENQKAQVGILDQAGAVVGLPTGATSLSDSVSRLVSDIDARHALAMRARSVVDGQGARRLAKALLGIPIGEVDLRPAAEGDADLLRGWRNDPNAYAHFGNPRPVSRGEHMRWLADVIADESRTLLIAHRAGAPVAQVRFDAQRVRACDQRDCGSRATWQGYWQRGDICGLRLDCRKVHWAPAVPRRRGSEERGIAARLRSGWIRVRCGRH